MTDILAKLVTLTAKDENGLDTCPWCNSAVTLEGHFNARSGTLYRSRCNSKKCSIKPETTYISHAQAVLSWNTGPREAALIALVQESAKEMERLRAALERIEMMDEGSTSTYLGTIARAY